MRVSSKVLAFFAAVNWVGLAFASDGSWRFDIEERGNPELRYSQKNKTVFYVGCGHAFGLHAVYPAAHKNAGEKATITIANANTRMTFKGEIEARHEDDPAGATHFAQYDLGYRRQDPNLYGARWKRLEARFLDLLDSGQPLTISTESGSTNFPPSTFRTGKSVSKKSAFKAARQSLLRILDVSTACQDHDARFTRQASPNSPMVALTQECETILSTEV